MLANEVCCGAGGYRAGGDFAAACQAHPVAFADCNHFSDNLGTCLSCITKNLVNGICCNNGQYNNAGTCTA